MSEEQEALIKLPDGDAIVPVEDDKAFDMVNSAGTFLPRLQLMTSNSAKCKAAEFPVNNYASVRGQDYQDHGKEVDVIVLAWRPKAIEMSDEVIAVYDIESAEFARIRDAAGVSDSGCMFGPEFLLWNDKLGFVTFFMGSKSARRESGTLRSFMGNAATLKSRLVKTAKYSWQAPLVTACSSFPADQRPDAEVLKEEYDKFKNPPASDLELADDETKTGREV